MGLISRLQEGTFSLLYIQSLTFPFKSPKVIFRKHILNCGFILCFVILCFCFTVLSPSPWILCFHWTFFLLLLLFFFFFSPRQKCFFPSLPRGAQNKQYVSLYWIFKSVGSEPIETMWTCPFLAIMLIENYFSTIIKFQHLEIACTNGLGNSAKKASPSFTQQLPSSQQSSSRWDG